MALIQVNYMSRALFRIVPLNVILPADKFDADTDRYMQQKDRKYKTLYLLHGLLGNYTDWVSQTRIQKWAEEKDLAVVMPSGDNSFYFRSRTPWNDYETFIGEELVEMTRRMFPLSERREDTFIAGLSMGGYGALRNGIVFSDTFGYAAGLSAALHLFDDLSEEANLGLFENLEAASKTNLNPKVAVEEMFQAKMFAVIPADYAAVTASINKGVAVTASGLKSAAAKGIADAANKIIENHTGIVPIEEKAKNKKGLFRLRK
jgi:S-formylglutathione hydrolase FrmB